MDDILNMRVGLQANTANAELFKRWFPGHEHTVEFMSANEVFDALEHGKIDLIMSSQVQLLTMTNYMERPGYKINMLFEYTFESTFGFNKNEKILCSIVDKALDHVNIKSISDVWLHKTYDYRVKLAQSRVPLLVSVSALLLCVIILISILLHKNRTVGKQLETLVEKRTVELNEQMKLMEAVAKNYKGIIWSVDVNKNITMFNGQYLKTINIEPSFILGKNLEAARKKNRHIDIINNVEKTLREGPQNWMSSIDGGTFLCNTMPIYDTNGNVVGVTGTTDDISEMVQLNHDLEEALEAAKAANRAKSVFLANMSHEIRTPMNSVIGFSELALDFDMPEKPREYIEKILKNSNWLLQIINDILDVSKIEAGKMTLENIPFDLTDVFALCRTAIGYKAVEKGLTLHFYAEPFIGKKLLGDPTRLRQIFINLISNSVKFTNVGAVKVSAEVKERVEDKVNIHFEVKDSGIGMTADQIEKVMEPFAQADYSTTRKYGGTGLGLSIIKSLVEMMGGELAVESTPGIGTKFSFYITFKTIDSQDDNSGAAQLGIADIARPKFAGEEVLVCEDNFMNQEVIRKHLERVGLRVMIAENGKVGLDEVQRRKQAGEKPFALIFMDINMPVMDGLESATKITEIGTGATIIAMTANVMSSDMELYRKCHMNDYVGKPFTSQELWHCLVKYIKPADVEKVADAAQPGYDADLILEMQTIFANDNQNTLAKFKAALEDGDIKQAHRLMHTLKSNAGTIGKTFLQKTAGQAEEMLCNGENRMTSELMNTVEAELGAVLAELRPLLKKATATAQTPDGEPYDIRHALAAEFKYEEIKELEELLRKGSPDSLKFTERLRQIKGSGELIQQIEDFDFDQALESFAKLAKKQGARDG
jgi:signal transduction histidine kinase/DNA-binding response OmpR family regulator